jgi:hypothetical protein
VETIVNPVPLITAAILLGLTAASADPFPRNDAPRTDSFYDRDGHFAGSAVRNSDGTTSTYDARGRYDGQVIRNSDGTTSYYDRAGRFVGSRSRR